MQLFGSLIAAASALLLASSASAANYAGPAAKDSTIMRSTVSCPDCPESNCYKCTLGNEDTLKANTGGLAFIMSLIGFDHGLDGHSIVSCNVTVPAFTRLSPQEIGVNVYNGGAFDWDESTVTSETVPGPGDLIAQITVPSYGNIGTIDITPACQAAVDGKFNIFFGSASGSYEFWSKDSGNPAILRAVTGIV
ncbi:hypothetical protein GGF46_005052 [Coemansia sp. RSA 552]|nr:hypothetical protein GGF46_005052 [Coemansia sp. RSA 552]